MEVCAEIIIKELADGLKLRPEKESASLRPLEILLSMSFSARAAVPSSIQTSVQAPLASFTGDFGSALRDVESSSCSSQEFIEYGQEVYASFRMQEVCSFVSVYIIYLGKDASARRLSWFATAD